MRGLFAATQFTSANGGTVEFTLSGEVSAAWLNGLALTPGAQFSAVAKAGLNTLVVKLRQDQPPSVLKLTAANVTFLLE